MAVQREIDPELVAQWEELRGTARAAYADAVNAGPDPDEDLLGAIAWRSTFPEPEPWDATLHAWVMEARAQRFTWREIAEALGDGADGEGRVQTRHDYREKKLRV